MSCRANPLASFTARFFSVGFASTCASHAAFLAPYAGSNVRARITSRSVGRSFSRLSSVTGTDGLETVSTDGRTPCDGRYFTIFEMR